MNIAEILKDCPKGTKLYSPLCGECKLDTVTCKSILVESTTFKTLHFNEDGTYYEGYDDAECLLFPSKENRDWDKFCQFKDGDIITTNLGSIFILKTTPTDTFEYNCYVALNYVERFVIEKEDFAHKDGCRFATEEEKAKLFDAIKSNGYKWNEETKTLEKLVESNEDVDDRIVMSGIYFDRENYADEVELRLNNYEIEIRDGKTYAVFKNQETKTLEKLPKFKVGDSIKKKNGISVPVEITSIGDEFYYSNTYKGIGILSIAEQDDYELVTDKFDIFTLKPFDKVLVRTFQQEQWRADFFSHYIKKADFPYNTVSKSGYYYCIPYNDETKHLLGTTDDCDEFYKIWE